MAGLRTGTGTQKALTAVEVLGVLLVAAAGFFFAPPHTIPDVHGSGLVSATSGVSSSTGLAMVFVLLTFGGWNEAAYISAELRRGNKGMVSVLIGGLFRSEEHTSELHSLMRISYAVFCLKKKKQK